MSNLHAHHSLLPAITAAQCGVNDGLVVLTLEGAQAILQGIRDDNAMISGMERLLGRFATRNEAPEHD